jgi:2-polyprenyl-6-methoxyphenol hydroxylase-like FAD-dependent oxidoreductase
MKNILILGGGTAGWLSACFLQTMLDRIRPKFFSITLVESEDIGIIGVGEATVPSMLNTLQLLGISELEFIQKCNATFKHANKFENWLDSPGKKDNYYYHTFQRPELFKGLNLIEYWKPLNKKKSAHRFAFDVSPQAALCEAKRAPKLPNSKPYEAPVGYAYHLDAVLFGKLLREKSLERGVTRIVDTVVDIIQDDTGDIQSLVTKGGKILNADLFVDCSGFQGLLINKTLKTPFKSYEKELFCDRAVTIQVPLKANDPINPYTTSTAMSNGWIWEIHLQDRKGIGYVYSSRHTSDEDAEKELREYIKLNCDNSNGQPRFLKMRIGRHEKMWNKNVLAVGLSGGFIEPLESSGIYLVEMALKLFIDFFPHAGTNTSLKERYNDHITGLYDEVMEFIVLHYVLTRREDTQFWKDNKFHQHIPEQLKKDLEMWQFRMPTAFDKGGHLNFFNHESFQHILAGMDAIPESAVSMQNIDLLNAAKKEFDQIKKTARQAVEVSPDHKYYVDLIKNYKKPL